MVVLVLRRVCLSEPAEEIRIRPELLEAGLSRRPDSGMAAYLEEL